MAKRMLLVTMLLVITLPLVVVPSAQAVTFDTLTTYYTGTCENLTYNGYKWRECNGTTTQSGTLSGTWRCDDVYDCVEGTFTYYWYERCNNTWVFRYSSSGVNTWPTSTDCHCT